jgi:hypothetical protein
MQRKIQKIEGDLTTVKITCMFCGRKRKKGLSRSALFCTKHCQTRWQDSHPGESPVPVESEESKIYFPQHKSRIPCNITLTPSPSPQSSPTVYNSPPSSPMFQIHKWKLIAQKLSIYSELKCIWNELKAKGGFVKNECFITHLLRCEAERQCVQYEILDEKDIPELTPLEPSNPLAATPPDHNKTLGSDILKFHDVKSMQSKVRVEQNHVGKPYCGRQDCELMVLKSQKQCIPDESGIYV